MKNYNYLNSVKCLKNGNVSVNFKTHTKRQKELMKNINYVKVLINEKLKKMIF